MVSICGSWQSWLKAERFLVELRYIMAVLRMYFSTFRRTPMTILSQLFGCLQDKINITAPVPLSGTSILFLVHFCSAISSSLLSRAVHRKWTAEPELVSRRDRSRTIVGVVSPASCHQNLWATRWCSSSLKTPQWALLSATLLWQQQHGICESMF